MRRHLTLLMGVTVASAAPLWAQNSVYGVRGIGFPERPISVRARAMGGGFAMFDALSPLNPATAANFRVLAASVSAGTTFRRYTADGTEVSGLRETRFPGGMVGGGVGNGPVSFAVGYAGFAERSFDIQRTGVDTAAGVPVEVSDRLSADGGIVDMRAALGWRIAPTFQVGAAMHVLNGSSRVVAARDFIDSDFRQFNQVSTFSFNGVGVSAGLNWQVASIMQMAFAGRWNGGLKSRVGSSSATIDMPVSVHGGLLLAPSRQILWSATAEWTSWSRAAGDLDAETRGVFDTWSIGSGLELGAISTRLPIRLGAYYGTLPFSPSADAQPYEWSLSAGTGYALSGGRFRVDAAVERLIRDGAGAAERGWHVSFGISVSP